MELNEMEKRLIFQTESYGKSDVTYELRMCLPYIPDPVKRKRRRSLSPKKSIRPNRLAVSRQCGEIHHDKEDRQL